MTNKQLQKILKQYPQDAEVVVASETIGCSCPPLDTKYEPEVVFQAGSKGTITIYID